MSELKKLPKFSLPASGDNMVDNSNLKASKYNVLYFYPKDNTPGCTNESIEFNDLLSEFNKLDCNVFGISADSVASHDKFVEKYGFNFLLLSDSEHALMKPLQVWGEKKNYGKVYEGIIRTTFLTDSEGNVLNVWRNVRAKGHAQKVLTYILDMSKQ